MVQDLIELEGEQVVNLRDSGINHRLRIFRNGDLPFEHLGNEFLHQALAPLTGGNVRSHPAFLNNLVQQSLFRDLLRRLGGRLCHFFD